MEDEVKQEEMTQTEEWLPYEFEGMLGNQKGRDHYKELRLEKFDQDAAGSDLPEYEIEAMRAHLEHVLDNVAGIQVLLENRDNEDF